MICTKCGREEARLIIGDGEGTALCPACADRLCAAGGGDPEEIRHLIGAYIDPLAAALEGTFFGGGTDAGSPNGNSLPDRFLPIDPDKFPEKDGTVCPLCKRTGEELSRGEWPGCPECYRVFGDRLFPKAGDGGKWHLPEKKRREVERAERLSALRGALETAVRAERFEEAADLRDSIRALIPETEPNNPVKEEKPYAMV